MSLDTSKAGLDAVTEKALANLELAIATAVLVPGKTYPKSRVAALSGVLEQDIAGPLSILAKEGYLAVHGHEVAICPLNIDAAMQSLDKICSLEIEIAALATARITVEQKGQLLHLMDVTRRGAMIGDIPSILAADRTIETVIGLASGEPEKAAELVELKREFKRAWCHTHRFRNVDAFVKERDIMIQAINVGNVDAVALSITQFFASLPQQFKNLTG